MSLLQNKVTVITGAAKGIGLACAQRMLKENAKVVLADIAQNPNSSVESVLKNHTTDSRYIQCDVGEAPQIEQLMNFAISEFGRIDCVIANAGIVHSSDILDLTEADFDRVLKVNLKGVFLTGQTAAKIMVEQKADENGSKGSIINMSSVNGVMTIPEIASYCIAKGGVNQWTKCLAIGLAKRGVRVNGIGPGSINTEMFQAVADNPDKLQGVLSRTPMGRPGEPDEIAKVAVFLASHYSSYLTGQTLYPDGGRMGLNYVVPVA